ncbi:hypothetical protein AB0880_29045 [Micromonospora chersina]|uniref:hypothetical protein n=1 Tax=Micromonospora chersina TaxID=47854 RepID=UPI003455B9E1
MAERDDHRAPAVVHRLARPPWLPGLVGMVMAGVAIAAVGAFLLQQGLEDADRWASVLGAMIALMVALFA